MMLRASNAGSAIFDDKNRCVGASGWQSPIEGCQPPQLHVEHQERRTSGLVWWGQLADVSRFEPTKSMRTDTTQNVRKAYADMPRGTAATGEPGAQMPVTLGSRLQIRIPTDSVSCPTPDAEVLRAQIW
jgi:hypothetical protein